MKSLDNTRDAQNIFTTNISKLKRNDQC